uniref:Uncharacterized protein n=1 Tax=Romanomermis culicivorax TaxID=13658 RepID=A0A915I4H0_ROMCU
MTPICCNTWLVYPGQTSFGSWETPDLIVTLTLTGRVKRQLGIIDKWRTMEIIIEQNTMKHFILTNWALRRTKRGAGRNSYDNTPMVNGRLNVGYTKLNGAFACK